MPLHKPSGADEYPASWRWSRLDDICDGVVDCPHSTPNLTSVGPLVARSQDIRAGVLDTEAAAHVSEATYRERIARAEPRHGDLLYSREGTYFGIAAEVPKDTRVCLGQRMVLIRPEPSQVNCRFLKYWLNSPAIVAHVRGFRDGSVAERLNLPTIRGLPVALPPLSEQDRIADALGCLDEKIGLNRRTSRTLESIARAIFKSWFVDFDLVRWKTEGNDVRLTCELAAAFPSALSTTLGSPHPEGWTYGELGDLVTERRERVGTGRQAMVLSAVSTGELVTSDDHFTKRVYSKDVGRYKVVVKNDLAYNPSRINIGSIGLLREELLGAVSPVYVVFTPRDSFHHFVDFFMKHDTTRAWVVQLSSGSVRQSLTFRDLASIPVVIPNEATVVAFNEIVDQMRSSQSYLATQSSKLAEVRDRLLLRLMSSGPRD